MLCLAFKVVPGEQEMRCLQREREALLQFKASLLDLNGFPLGPLPPIVANGRGFSAATSLAISHFPEFLASLSNLTFFDLSWCHFGGKIPSQFGSLPHLKYLNLAGNELEGSIPPQLGNLSKLEYLDLSENNFEGNIPFQLGNLFMLEYLDLTWNNFEGNLPSQLGNLSNLQKFYLGGSYNGVQEINDGELSLIDCSLSNHFILSLRPYQFNFSTSLLAFHLSWNTFTSPVIFPWVSNITSNLVELYLDGNNLEVFVSNHFGMATNSLEHLDLFFNSFKGEVLKSFKNICTSHSLSMQGNNLTEDLPSILHNLSNGCIRYSLQNLDLSNNKIVGSLSDISLFLALKSLDLSRNRLNGKIREDIKLPSQMGFLSISSNFLEGGIPKSFGNACALRTLDMTNNNLSDEFSMIIHYLSRCARSHYKN
ncbi:hypothetical protein VNO80_13329 [Phaseolus coccineus]|uniref:Disease resistance R13L4/SHOC-2-like LRR domain-containing protein n=1 Tax=Phaseolus coccineus TaxID=3886 RepID=A0AAN9R9U1_PHACN